MEFNIQRHGRKWSREEIKQKYHELCPEKIELIEGKMFWTDAAMGFAYAATLSEGESFTTVELKINFLRAVRKGKLAAEAKVVKAGSILGYVECEVTDASGKLVAKAASTCIKLRQEKA